VADIDRARAFSRCLVVDSIDGLRECTQSSQSPLIIVAPGECVEAAGAAIEKGHHVVLTLDANVINIRDDFLQLSRPHRSLVEASLARNGFSSTESQSLARDFGRSIPVLRRHLSHSSAVSTPKWANAESARLLLPALFAGTWVESQDGDRRVIEELSGLKYDDYIQQLQQFLSLDDSPLRKIGNVWLLKSPLDAWVLLARQLDKSFLKRFRQSVLAVLTQTDPKYDLPPEDRWAAAIYGKSSRYSGYLRSGLVESLILLAVYGDRCPNVGTTQAFSSLVVGEIFGAADKWEAWASLKDVTPLLAEAAPDAFMDAVEQRIAEKPKIFEELMRDGEGLFGECRHAGLLWALESLAWSSEFFARAVDVLYLLAKADPGGNWNNRAGNSLKELFLPGFPQTYATPEERLASFDSLCAADPGMVWKFAHKYYSNDTISESHRLRWRDAGGERRGLEPEKNPDHQTYVTGLLPRLIDLSRAPENLITTADHFTRFPTEIRTKFIATLESVDLKSVSKEVRMELTKHLREAVNWIDSYGDAERKAHVSSLAALLDKFAPDDVLERADWLLDNPWPRLPQGESSDVQKTEVAINAARENATREVLDQVPIERLVKYVSEARYVVLVGHTLGKVIRDSKEDAAVLNALLGQRCDNPWVVKGYALGRVEVIGSHWINEQVERLKTEGIYSPEGCAALYLGLPEGAATWSQVNTLGEDVERAYWKLASGYSRSNKAADSPIAVEKLLDAERPEVALEIAGDPQLSLPSALLQRLIQEMLAHQQKESPVSGMEEFRIGQVVRQLYERNELPLEEMAKLEWPFAGHFDEIRRYTSAPLAIHRVLQKDPSWFAQLVSFTYKRDDHAEDPAHEGMDQKNIQNIARNARNVLNSWNLLPGLKSDSTVDEKELSDWIESARQQCAAANRVIGGDIQIGFLLAHAPADTDATWPHVAVRNVIEHLKNKTIDDHIENGLFNNRGVVSRELNEGGTQERDLSGRYKELSDTVRAKWPRTAAILRSLARSYEQYAKHEDISADLNDLHW